MVQHLDTSVWRTPEIEEGSNLYLIHPLSAKLVSCFQRWGVTPNTVSLLGLLSVLFGAFCFYHYQYWYMSLAGFFLHGGVAHPGWR